VIGPRARLAPALALAALGLTVLSAQAEVVQKGSLRMSVHAELRPHHLPRSGHAPIAVSIASRLATTDGSVPPPLKKMRIEFNRGGRLDTVGLPECKLDQIQPASTMAALRACRPALVGEGSFSVDVVLGGQDPYPTTGRLLLFNARYKGRPAVLGQIYSPHPFANSFVIPLAITQPKHGPYGIALSGTLPRAFTSWGHITALQLHLARRYRYKGASHSFLSGACPAPKGFSGAVFSLARTSFTFAGGRQLTSALTGNCTVRR
jgi:hypothetical protein